MVDIVYDEKTRNKIKSLLAKISAIDRKKEEYKEEIEKLKIELSPIKIGDIIQWYTGSTKRRGRVKAISTNYCNYSYRCKILSSEGKEIGIANVSESHFPTLELNETTEPNETKRDTNKRTKIPANPTKPQPI